MYASHVNTISYYENVDGFLNNNCISLLSREYEVHNIKIGRSSQTFSSVLEKFGIMKFDLAIKLICSILKIGKRGNSYILCLGVC